MPKNSACFLIVAIAMILAACQPDDPAAAGQDGGGPASGPSQAKPMAPIDIRYDVVGAAVVGQPIQVNVVVHSDQGPVDIEYTINDGSALVFQEGQVERLQVLDPSAGSQQQLTVIPQREGRVFVNVSATVNTPDGAMVRSMAIPIRVGKAPQAATPNGEVVEGPDGEAVNSLPATEN